MNTRSNALLQTWRVIEWIGYVLVMLALVYALAWIALAWVIYRDVSAALRRRARLQLEIAGSPAA